MKKAAVLAFAAAFAVCMVHFYYAEDHCPVHCPTKGGRFGHVHDHHAGASTCLCFWSALSGPEADEFSEALPVASLTPAGNEIAPDPPPGADIAHPPPTLAA
jgi:hypothetical protein